MAVCWVLACIGGSIHPYLSVSCLPCADIPARPSSPPSLLVTGIFLMCIVLLPVLLTAIIYAKVCGVM